MKALTSFLIFGYTADANITDPFELTYVVDFLTIAAGVLCIASAVVVGLQYLTAPSGSPKIRQSKRHLFEIVIGFTVYATIYALLRWILLIFSN